MKNRVLALLAGAALLLAGCAVMTVDVDVYKGPLNNDPDVQLEQLSNMANGARPLLRELRNTLASKNAVGLGDDFAREIGNNAEQVQAILSLYYDTKELDDAPSELRLAQERGERALRAYRVNYSILYDSEREPGISNVIRSLEREGTKLAHAYAALLRGDVPAGAQLEYPSVRIFDARRTRPGDIAREANAIFRWLPAAATSDADHLLRDRRERVDFRERVEAISRAFLRSRAALEDHWLSVLEIGEYVNRHPYLVPDLKSFNETLAGYAALFIRPTHFVAAYWRGRSITLNESPELNAYLNRQRKFSASDKKLRQLVTAAVEASFQTKPIETIVSLRKAHEEFKANRRPYLHPHDNDLRFPTSREFGLVRGPTVDEEALSPQNVTRLWEAQVTAQLPFHGFERGRLKDGLFTVTEAFLNASRTNHNSPEYFEARRVLLDELARFATKVLFMANNKALIAASEGRQNIQAFTTGLQAIGNSILVECDELRKQFRHTEELNRGALAERMALTSIHGSTEELLDLIEYRIQLEAPSAHQTNALKRIQALRNRRPSSLELSFDALFARLARGGERGVTNLFHQAHTALRTNLFFGPALRNRKEVLDFQITKMEYAYLDEIRKNGPTQVSSNLFAALNFAYEYRTGMIYVRPASAYLRSSYPATAVQQGTHAGWRNMLAQQHTRALNIANIAGPERSKAERLIGEVDRISWQRINEIRVAAGGNSTYVLAKDDVGNWYVKNFQAEVTNIINSMKNLASFALKTAIPPTSTELLKTNAVSASGGTVTNISGLDLALNKLQTNAVTTSRERWFSLTNSVASLAHNIRSGLQGTGLDSGASNALRNALLHLDEFRTNSANVVFANVSGARSNAASGFRALYRASLRLRGQTNSAAATNAAAVLKELKRLLKQQQTENSSYEAGLAALQGGI